MVKLFRIVKTVNTLINLKESEKIEFKEKFGESLTKEIVAFLNTDGGTIYIGIADNGEVVGIKEKLDDAQRKISDLITNQISPRCLEFVHSHKEIIEGKEIIQIDVSKGSMLYYIKKYGLSETGCYVRIGSTCKSLTPEEIMKRYEANMPEPSMKEKESGNQHLTFNVLKTALVDKGFHVNDDTFLNNYGLLTKDGKYNLVADLFADENDISIKIARFEGIDKSKLVERTEYGYKSIILSIRRTLDRFEALNITKSTIKMPERVDKKLFNMDALREAFLNAIVHTKWTELNPPQIQVFNNRIEIISTGRTVKDLTKEEFFKGVSKLRNPELMRILHDLEFVEQTGFGIPTIVKVYGEETFEFLDDFVMVTIPFDEEVMSSMTNVPHDVPHDVPHEDIDIIVSMIRNNPNVTRNEMASAINKSTKTVQRIINKHGKIIYVGSGDNGHWKIKE